MLRFIYSKPSLFSSELPLPNIYLPSRVFVNPFPEQNSAFLDVELSLLLFELISMKKPGSFGFGNLTPSFDNIKTTEFIVGRSSEYFWTHNKPTWMHLNTWGSTEKSSKHESINSFARSSFHSNHACIYNSCTHIYISILLKKNG